MKKARITRKELKGTIRDLRIEVANLKYTIRNRPPVFDVDGVTLEGCEVIVTQVDVSTDMIVVGGDLLPIAGLSEMTLLVTGPPPRNIGVGHHWLIPNGVPLQEIQPEVLIGREGMMHSE